MTVLQRDLYQQLRAEAIATRERITPVLRALDEAKLNERPDPKKWSIGQILEHLVKGDELFEAPSRTLIAGARPDAGAPSREWKPTLLGKMIAGAIKGPRPMKAPKVFQPGPTPRHGIVEAFLAREMNFLKAMEDAAGYDWRALRLSSPALPSWFPKMNLGDALKIHVVHVTRHSRHIEKAAAKL